jgi:hypothetical protein
MKRMAIENGGIPEKRTRRGQNEFGWWQKMLNFWHNMSGSGLWQSRRWSSNPIFI